MVFRRFVEIGRVIIINYGPLIGKLAVIVDVLTTTKVVIQGLKGGVKRQELSLRRVTLTDEKINIKRGAKRDEVFKAIEDYKLEEKFKNSKYAKKVELRQRRANLTDFDRFKVMRLRQRRAVLRHIAVKGVKAPAGDAKKDKKEKHEKKEKKEKKEEIWSRFYLPEKKSICTFTRFAEDYEDDIKEYIITVGYIGNYYLVKFDKENKNKLALKIREKYFLKPEDNQNEEEIAHN